MKRLMTQTNTIIINGDMTIDINRIGGGSTLDFSLKNNGTADASLTVNSGGDILLLAGDPMMSWTGYFNAFRRDVIQFTFGAGTPRIELQYTRVVDRCDFDV